MKVRKIAFAAAAVQISRRQFTGLLGGSGLLALTGCGGGGGSGDEAAPVAPPPVVTPPVITAQPQSQSVAPGATLSLRVEATGQGLAYQWKRNGIAVTGASSATLALTAQLEDNGAQYTAVVSNSAGSVETQAALLGVVRVSPPGISLLAGGLGGTGMLEGRGTQARLNRPESLALAPDGSIYMMSTYTMVARISPDGSLRYLTKLKDIDPGGMAVDSHGTLFACGHTTSNIYKLVETGGAPNFVPVVVGVQQPNSPVFDKSDNLYFIESGSRSIRRMSPAGAVTTVAGQSANSTVVDGQGGAAGFADPRTLLLLPDGNFLVLDGDRLRKMTPEGVVSTLPRPVPAMRSLVVGDANTLYGVVGQSVIRLTIDSGAVSTIAGQSEARGYVEGAAAAARFNEPLALVLAPNGELVVADNANEMLRRVVPSTGQTSAWVGSARQIGHVDATGAQARFAEMGVEIGPTVVDRSGNVYVLETVAKTLRKVTPAGVVSTLFEDFPSGGGLALDAAGNFFGVRDRTIVKVTPASAQSVFAGQAGGPGFADGTGTAAQFTRPQGLKVDPQGNLLVGDGPEITQPSFIPTATFRYGNTIRKITPAGVVTTIAGVPGRVFDVVSGVAPPANPLTEFHRPSAIGCDAAGQVYVLDTTRRNIRRLGAPGTDPVILFAYDNLSYVSSDGLAVTPSGDVYFAERAGFREFIPNTVFERDVQYDAIRKVTSQGSSIVVAGQVQQYGEGVTLGPLPGTLNIVSSLAAAGNDTLFCCTENSVLEVQLT